MDKRKRRLLCMLEGSGRKSRWISGALPLSFKAKKAGTLENYRIYGNTVGGESVGDLVESGEHAGEYKAPVTVEGKNLFDPLNSTLNCYLTVQGGVASSSLTDTSEYIPVKESEMYTLKLNRTSTMLSSKARAMGFFNAAKSLIGTTEPLLQNNDNIICHLIAPQEAAFFRFSYDKSYGDITLKNNIVQNLYLPEQIRKVGDEADYIDFFEQKMHRIGADDIDVTLPALPILTGTNVMSVGTEVQPSEIEVKGKIKAL